MTRLLSLWRRLAFRRDRRGSVAMIAGLSILPIVMLTGLAIDLSFTIMAKSRLDLAADAAALAAAKTAANEYAAGVVSIDTATNTLAYIVDGTNAGYAWFTAQAGSTTGLNLSNTKTITLAGQSVAVPTLSVTQNGGIFTASLTYSGTMRTQIASFFGFPAFPVNGTSQASITVGGYADINIMMDVSSSMGIAATAAGIAALGPLAAAYDKTNKTSHAQSTTTCAFGCHWAATNDFYTLAHANGIQLRIDVLISAVQTVVQQLITQNTNSLYRVGLYTFANALNTIFPISSDLNSGLTAAKAVTVPICCNGNDNETFEPDTNFPAALSAITTAVGTSYSGSSATTPRKYLFIVTDGISDYYNCTTTNCSSGRTINTMLPAYCSTLKNNGVTVLVLYTDYTPLVNSFYTANVAPYINNGSALANLQSCASSSSYFFHATDPTAIQAAMLQMLQIALSAQARFTQ